MEKALKFFRVLLVFVFYFIFLVSCRKENIIVDEKLNNEKLRKIENEIDSLQNIRSGLSDSIIKADQNRFIYNINFGDSEYSVNKKLSDFYKKCAKKKFKDHNELYYFIGNYEFLPENTKCEYYNGGIYKIIIKGHSISYDDYDIEIKNNVEFLSKNIISKYKLPKEEFHIPEKYNIDKNYIYYVKRWNVGLKKIDIIVNKPYNSFYSVDLHIYNKEVDSVLENKDRIIFDKNNSKDKDIF